MLIEGRKARYQSLINFICEQTGKPGFHADTGKTLFFYVEQLGEEIVYPWIERAAEKTSNDQGLGRYVSGIRRSFLAEREVDL